MAHSALKLAKRAFLLAVILACSAVLILAGLGVWEPPSAEQPESGAPETKAGHQAAFKKPRTRWEDGELTADAGAMNEEGQLSLVRPRIEVIERSRRQPSTRRRITLRADRGILGKGPKSAVLLERNVHVETRESDANAAGVPDRLAATLNTDRLTWDREKSRGQTDSFVTLKVIQEGAENIIRGREVELDHRAHRVSIARQVSLLSSKGGAILLTVSDPGTKPKGVARERLHVICKGPLVYDGIASRITMKNDVAATQGKARLYCDELKLYVDPRMRAARRVEASGNVKVKDAVSSAYCDRLVRDVTQSRTDLYGKSECSLVMARTTIVARKPSSREPAQVTFREKDGLVEILGPGGLTTAARLETVPEKKDDKARPKQESAGRIHITWRGSMSFSPQKHRATLKRQVQIKGDARSISGDTVHLQFDNRGQRLSQLTAEGHVQLTGPDENARGDRLIIRPVEKETVLVGDEQPACLHARGLQMECARIELWDRGQTILGTGPGKLRFARPSKTPPASAKPAAASTFVQWAKSVAYDGKNGLAEFTGNVICERAIPGAKEKQELRAEKLHLTLGPSREVTRLVAEGSVRLRRRLAGGAPAAAATEEARGDRLTWDFAKDVAVLTGKPASLDRPGIPAISGHRIRLLKNFSEIIVERRSAAPPGDKPKAP